MTANSTEFRYEEVLIGHQDKRSLYFFPVRYDHMSCPVVHVGTFRNLREGIDYRLLPFRIGKDEYVRIVFLTIIPRMGETLIFSGRSSDPSVSAFKMIYAATKATPGDTTLTLDVPFSDVLYIEPWTEDDSPVPYLMSPIKSSDPVLNGKTNLSHAQPLGTRLYHLNIWMKAGSDRMLIAMHAFGFKTKDELHTFLAG